jgi:hypothetical protein
MLATENIILKTKFIAYVSDLEQCIFTKTLPSIAWKPNPSVKPAEAILKVRQASSDARKVQLKFT